MLGVCGRNELLAWFTKRSQNFDLKTDENAKLQLNIHLISELWLQILIFQPILVQRTLSLPNIYFWVARIGYAKDFNKITPKMANFSCRSTHDLGCLAHVFKIWPNVVLAGS